MGRSVTPNVRAKRTTTARRLARVGENTPRISGPDLVGLPLALRLREGLGLTMRDTARRLQIDENLLARQESSAFPVSLVQVVLGEYLPRLAFVDPRSVLILLVALQERTFRPR